MFKHGMEDGTYFPTNPDVSGKLTETSSKDVVSQKSSKTGHVIFVDTYLSYLIQMIQKKRVTLSRLPGGSLHPRGIPRSLGNRGRPGGGSWQQALPWLDGHRFTQRGGRTGGVGQKDHRIFGQLNLTTWLYHVSSLQNPCWLMII